jgi:hypothetical protein
MQQSVFQEGLEGLSTGMFVRMHLQVSVKTVPERNIEQHTMLSEGENQVKFISQLVIVRVVVLGERGALHSLRENTLTSVYMCHLAR